MAETDRPAAEIEGFEETIEGLDSRRSELAELTERGEELREQARDLASRDLELSAERQEASQHLRRLAEELERLFHGHLAEIDEQEVRAARVLESLRERAQLLVDRERRLIEQQERAGAAEALLQERSSRLEQLRAE